MGVWDGTPATAESGTTIKVKFCDTEQANSTITVHVTRDDEVPAADFTIDLDENGCGEADWAIPFGPTMVEFTTDGHPSHPMFVTEP